MTIPNESTSHPFLWRRLHSLAGFWLVLFIIVHLLTNAQAALFVGNDGRGFIESANSLESLPFLPILEALILGVPIIIHGIWGIKYIRTAKYNSFATDGTAPALPQYTRNKAYTWQRLTSWVILIGIIAHVIHMRFVERPISSVKDGSHYHMVRISRDDGLYTLSKRLDFTFYDQNQIQKIKAEIAQKKQQPLSITEQIPADRKLAVENMLAKQQREEWEAWIAALEKRPLREGDVVAVTHDFGTADLLMLRDTFKMPLMIALYTIFVITTCYHAFNGLWTFLIKWGIILTPKSQRIMLTISWVLISVMTFLGLAAVWGTYWINLRY